MTTASRISDAATAASQSFARFCAGLQYDALPPVAVERVKHFFVDYIGIALHASTLDSSGPQARRGTAGPGRDDALRPGRPG
jgi:2-methylcitrate dehydratase PrpD